MSANSSIYGLAVVAAISFGVCNSSLAVPSPTYLTNPGVYAATASSIFSDFGDFSVGRLFDGDNNTNWAIDGYLGNNSQGRDEGWVSVTLDQQYLISHLQFAARKPSGSTDGIDRAHFWISSTPFGVNVTNKTATNSFLATLRGQNPDLTVGPFANFNDIDYSLNSVLNGKYLLARFVNTTDLNTNRNLGARTLEVGVIGTVPEPSTFVLGGMAIIATIIGVRRSRRDSAWMRTSNSLNEKGFVR